MPARIIDNKRVRLADVLVDLAKDHKNLSIATGYWDLPGFKLIFENIMDFESVRLLIGQEPNAPYYAPTLDLDALDETFPEKQMISDLEKLEYSDELRSLVKGLKQMIDEGRLQVRVHRKNFLHAKIYIFGSEQDKKATGIIGSSNFTAAGLTRNIELNALEDDGRIVKSVPKNETDEHGHLSWFNEMWNSENSEIWDGKFVSIIENSPVGDLLFSEYHMYIKTLYELYKDELVPETEVSQDIENVLYDFQLRNAKLLINKLKRNGLAMLADSVGLGKTITAGAVLKYYLDELEAKRVYIIAPAGLISQWRDDLMKVHGLFHGFEIISMQDLNKIQNERALDKYAPVDLFVIDEAHNLRSGSGIRHDEFLNWFSQNQNSHVLLLTATPINNSLTDFVNQIQLAAKGNLTSFPVVYPTSKKTEVIDFFEAVKRLNRDIQMAEDKGKQPDYEKVHRVMRQGLRHFLVRSTRAGIEKEFGGVRTPDGSIIKFPASRVFPTPYKFSKEHVDLVTMVIAKNLDAFEGKNIALLDIQALLNLTQRSQHPLDIIETDLKLLQKPYVEENAFKRIFQVLLLLGFAPYKTDTYKHQFYGKPIEDISKYKLTREDSFRLNSQLSVHNMLRITLLKRLESSQFALSKSLTNYEQRIIQYLSVLDRGYLAPVKDIESLISEYGDDLEKIEEEIFVDDESNFIAADSKTFNLEAIRKDLNRDLKIIKVLQQMCIELGKNDDKLTNFAQLIERIRKEKPAGSKILIFSYYTDTVQYLAENLDKYYKYENLKNVVAFTNGKSKSQIESLAKRFSPISKNGDDQVKELGEIDILVTSDVLSEGQNLQDCGTLINFDLHWNPVRMIQRNGRINRLGSTYPEVYIYNIHPDLNLDEYLTLVKRLQRKIDRIKFTVGTDQSVLGEDANPIEFADDMENPATEIDATINLYNPEKADEVIKKLEDESDIFGEDEFVFDLRKFDKNASHEEKVLLESIPIGKWGRLSDSASTKLDSASALSLMRIQGRVLDSDEEFENYLFVSRTEGVGPVETIKALLAIRVDDSKSKRLADDLAIDRSSVNKQAKQVAANNLNQISSLYRITPSVTKMLDAYKKQNPESDLYVALTKISTKQEMKRIERLKLRASKDISEHGVLLQDTVVSLNEFVNELLNKPAKEKNINKNGIVGVLHFGK